MTELSSDAPHDDSTQDDPYRSPESIDSQSDERRSARPGALTAICVLALLLGGLGIVFGLGGFVLTELGVGGGPTGDKEMDKIKKTVDEVQSQYLGISIAMALIHVPVALLLVLGGVQGLRLRPSAGVLLFAAFVGAIVFEIARAAAYTVVQLATIDAVNDEIHLLSGDGASATFKAIMYATMGCSGVYLTGKLVLYGWAAFYVRKPKVRSLFKSQDSPAP